MPKADLATILGRCHFGNLKFLEPSGYLGPVMGPIYLIIYEHYLLRITINIDCCRLLSIKSVWFDYSQLLTRLLSIVFEPDVTYSLAQPQARQGC